MLWHLGPAWDDEADLGKRWREAAPFAHLVFDDFVPAESLDELLNVLDEEPVDRYEQDIFVFEASRPEPRTDGLRKLRDDFAVLLAPPLSRITGKTLRRADMRAYAYRPGHYLLPHTDHQQGVGRAVAFAYYLPSPEPPIGGELEFFRIVRENAVDPGSGSPPKSGDDGGTAIVAMDSAGIVSPRANRLVVFDVGDDSLHQVREVLGGLRVSLAGWFYP